MAKPTDIEEKTFIKLMNMSKVKPLKQIPKKLEKPFHQDKTEPIEFISSETPLSFETHVDLSHKYDGAGPPPRRVSPKRLKVNRRFTPDFFLDLHGITKIEAIELTEKTLLSAKQRQLQSVLVITGRGNHSGKKGSVLRRAVRDWLEQHQRDYPIRFQTAPSHLGGDGAFLVFISG